MGGIEDGEGNGEVQDQMWGRTAAEASLQRRACERKGTLLSLRKGTQTLRMRLVVGWRRRTLVGGS